MRVLGTLIAGLLITAAVAGGQQSVVKRGQSVTATAEIVQIDSTARLITFKGEDGTEDTVYAEPEFKRFNELKVGDRVKMTYYESTVYRIRKPGDPAALNAKADSNVTPGSGALPSVTAARQTVKTVTVKSVDADAGAITVTTRDGRTVTRKVEDKSNLANLKAGDTIEIVYTEAILANVERPK
jgi:Cu/Ag efflux protein CusF